MTLLPILLAATTLLPGLWEYKTSLAGMGGGDPERKCLTKAEIDRFLTNPENRHYDCAYPTKRVSAGKVKLEGVCTSRKHAEQTVGVAFEGDYTPTTISLKGVARPRIIAGLELPVSASVTAERVSAECPAEPAG